MSKLNSNRYYVANSLDGETLIAGGQSIENIRPGGRDSQVAGMLTGC